MIGILRLSTILLTIIILSSLVGAEVPDTLGTNEIKLQNLTMQASPGNQIFNESLLPGEIAETEIGHIALAGPLSQTESLSEKYDTILLFVKGTGSLQAGNQNFPIESESIAILFSFKGITIQVVEGDTLHYIRIRKELSGQDVEDINALTVKNRSKIYFTRFDDCKAYTEKIKSPNTVSRTVLPKDYIPRVAMGTVETIGPDTVGAHRHPMLDQLFLGLSGNDVIVHADDKTIHFPEFSILHIPIGSSHGVTVEKNKRMYYMWMDFFLTKKGEVWLETHKAIENNPDK